VASSSLDQLRQTVAVIDRLDLTVEAGNRLKSLGIFVGQRIELARQGNPLIIKAAGSRVAIAQALAKCILVREAEA